MDTGEKKRKTLLIHFYNEGIKITFLKYEPCPVEKKRESKINNINHREIIIHTSIP